MGWMVAAYEVKVATYGVNHKRVELLIRCNRFHSVVNDLQRTRTEYGATYLLKTCN
jgi:hypothetical protein